MFMKFYTETGEPYSINVAPKQKIIKVHRNNYIDFQLNQCAQKNLSPYAYMLYMYLLVRSKDRAWAMSSKDICENTTLTKKTYPKAVEELIEKGYLVPKEISTEDNAHYSKNTYHLLEHNAIKI